MSILKLENATRQFRTEPVWEDINITVNIGDRIGIIGHNGCGKSTLLQVLAGVAAPDKGKLTIAKGTKVGYLPQNPQPNPELTVYQTICASQTRLSELFLRYDAACQALEEASKKEEAGEEVRQANQELAKITLEMDALGAWDLKTRIAQVANRIGISDLHAKMGELSIGQQKRAALAQALLSEPDILLLDEPTNHLDCLTIDWLENFLYSFKGSLVIVTHDRYFLDKTVNRIVEIERGQLHFYEGCYADFLAKKEHQAELDRQSAEKHSNLLRREMAWFKRGARARSTKQKARQERLMELLAQHPERESRHLNLTNIAKGARLGNKGLILHNIDKAFGEKRVISDFSVNLRKGDRVGLVGANGSGKTTLLNIIAEHLQPDKGYVELGATVVPGYYSQDSASMDPGMSALDYVREASDYIFMADGTRVSAASLMEQFLFPRPMQHTTIGRLSGGERRRLYLLRVLMGNPNMLLLDEPTNDLDLPTLIRLEAWLDDFAGILIVVSHDRYFLDRTVDKLYWFDQGCVRLYQGSYDDLRNDLYKSQNQPHETLEKEVPEPRPATSGKQRKLIYKEKRELEAIEKEMSEGDLRLQELEREMELNATDGERMAQLYGEYASLKERLSVILERWEELSLISEG